MTDKSAASIKAERAARPAIELTQDGAELSPKNPCDLSHAHLRLGIDVGSTTVKLAVIDDNDHLVYANYERHHTDVRATAKAALRPRPARHRRHPHARLHHRLWWHAAGQVA